MKQPHEGITGVARLGNPLLSLDDTDLPIQAALITMARHLSTATLVGNPAPVVQRMSARLRNPRPGDLVIETSNAQAMRFPGWRRGFGYLVDKRREWWDTDDEYARLLSEGDYDANDPRPVDTAWYVQYGPAPVDVCRWTNCSFMVIPIDEDTFSVPFGDRDGTATVITRDGLLGSLADSGFLLRPPTEQTATT